MRNERLRTALMAAHADVRALADRVGVDPKTVQRWMNGRVPHPRHRAMVAKLLKEREDYLWEAEPSPTTGAAPVAQTAEILTAYGRRSDVHVIAWRNLFERAHHQIDCLGYAIHFLPEQMPDIADLFKDKSAHGCRVRIAVGDPDSQRIRDRDDEEQLEGTLPARIRSTLRHFRDLFECPNVEIHFHTAPLYNSVFRADDEMHVTPHLYSLHGSKAPLLHVRRLGPHGVFEGFAQHFEAIWATTVPAIKLATAAAAVSVARQ